MSKNSLYKKTDFHKGDYLVSNNKQWKAIFQSDGNFVIYGWKPVWASNTCGSDALRLCMQDDCNLVMYNKCGNGIWETNIHRPGCDIGSLRLTDDGKLLIYVDDDQIWSSCNSEDTK